MTEMITGDEIAIIGMAGRFPGAKNIEEFWNTILHGKEEIHILSEDELLSAGVDPALLLNPKYVRATVPLDEFDLFDAPFFGIAPREAELLDPQQRLFLECCWSALEDAGYDAERYPGWIGVYGGVSTSDYQLLNIASHPELIEKVGHLQIALGNDKDYLATRVSYKLNLNGPSMAVQTACSSSLVAVHMACQSLLHGECSLALAGGSSLSLPQGTGYLYREGDVLSPDGHCRSFDARAQGAIRGSGVGVVVLKLLEHALSSGDHIHAVIKGSAVNNDGSLKLGFTTPSVDRQAEVIDEALKVAQVEAATVSYVEAHGSGTPLGDPIEIAALSQAFRRSTQESQFCALGSVKANIGHLAAASGVAGLIKTVLALKKAQLPPQINFAQPNPQIDLCTSPFYVNMESIPWRTKEGVPRRAGVSSFGLGGTNAHVVLEEAPSGPPSGPSRPYHLLLLSAATATGLEKVTAQLADHLHTHPEQALADIAYTYQIGRKALPYRRMLVCQHADEALEALEKPTSRNLLSATHKAGPPSITFMFPGIGDHYSSMALELYQQEEVFRRTVDQCCRLLQPHLQLDLQEILFPERRLDVPRSPTSGSTTHIELRTMLGRDQRTLTANAETQKLQQTLYSHAALFVIEYALAQLWMTWGIQPRVVIGYSIGEYVAACLAGVFSLPDALFLVAERSRLIQTLPEGAMSAVTLGEAELAPLLTNEIAIASVNSPTVCIISGPLQAVADLEQRLHSQGILFKRLQTSHALHSAQMQPIVEPFKALVKTIRLHPPTLPYLSSVTGQWITAEEATDPSYWAKHLTGTIRFAEGLHSLITTEKILLEVGPGRTLCNIVWQHTGNTDREAPLLLASLPPSYEQVSDLRFLLQTLGSLWLHGAAIDWTAFYNEEQRQRLALPTYPFERHRYWIEPHRPRPSSIDPATITIENGTSTEHTALSNGTIQAASASYPRPQLLNDYVEPANNVERTLARIWEDILGIGPIGSNDSFFELGGHSLSSVQLVFRLREAFQIAIPIDYPFKTPVLADLATVVEEMLLDKLEALSEEEAQHLMQQLFSD